MFSVPPMCSHSAPIPPQKMPLRIVSNRVRLNKFCAMPPMCYRERAQRLDNNSHSGSSISQNKGEDNAIAGFQTDGCVVSGLHSVLVVDKLSDSWHPLKIAARVLATYLIPGCVGRGVRLGSENSSGAAGGVRKSGDHFSEKKKAPAATYPQVQGFQNYEGHFSEKIKAPAAT